MYKAAGRPVKLASLILIIIGVILLVLTIIFGGKFNIALPLVFILLGGVFFILALAGQQKTSWASILFIPGGLLVAMGIVLLVSTLTADGRSWAYSWLLLVTGLGFGLVLTSRQQAWPSLVGLIGWGMALLGITFFVVFGAITGGLFIQIMAPVMIILGGLMLFWLRLENVLPEPVLRRLHLAAPPADAKDTQAPFTPASGQMIEALSARELEVLRLVDEGLSNQQIALRLNVAQSTVKTHINNIYAKLEVETRTQAIGKAHDLKLIIN